MYDAIFLDVDGTLTKGLSCWQLAHTKFGVQDQARKYYDKAMKGELSFGQWAELDVGLWRGQSLQNLLSAILPPHLIEGAKEGIGTLKETGAEIILLSGGFNYFVDAVAKELNVKHAYSNLIHESNGTLTGKVTVKVGNSKKIVIEEIADRFGFDVHNTAAIGDNFNDIDMFQTVKHSIAFNPKVQSIVKVATKRVDSPNFVDPVNVLLSL